MSTDAVNAPPVRCANCDRKWHPSDLSEELCPLCVAACEDDAERNRAEAMRPA